MKGNAPWVSALPEDIFLILARRGEVAAFCHNCGREVVYDPESGTWIHIGYGKVDGRNGLYCSPGMWDGSVERVYAKPSRSAGPQGAQA